MASIQLQFHGEPSELLVLADSWIDRYRLSAVIEQFFPEYRAFAPAQAGIARTAAESSINRICFGLHPLSTAVSSAFEFLQRNPNCMALTVGRLDEEGLRESALSTATRDRESLRTWREVSREAKAIMHQGASVCNPQTGAAQHLASHLHTPGAHALAEQGFPMLPAAGWNEFRFDDCPSTRSKAQ